MATATAALPQPTQRARRLKRRYSRRAPRLLPRRSGGLLSDGFESHARASHAEVCDDVLGDARLRALRTPPNICGPDPGHEPTSHIVLMGQNFGPILRR